MIYEKLKYYAERKPHDAAIADARGKIGYAELFQNSLGLMHWLAKQNINQESRIVVAATRGRETAFALYAALFCGATYIPLDAALPLEKKMNVLEETKADVVIVNLEEKEAMAKAGYLTLAVVEENLAKTEDLTVHQAAQWGIDHAQSPSAESHLADSLLAYIIFTSGSTGKQKGVCIKRRSLFAFVEKYCIAMNYEQDIRMLGITSLSGDGSMIQHLCTHYMGGTLFHHHYKLPSDLIRHISHHRITDIDCSATIVKIMASRVSGLSSVPLPFLKRISYGGDNLPLKYIKDLKTYIPDVDIYNGYGPTECTVLSSLYRVDDKLLLENDDVPVPIGKPFEGVEFLLIDSQGTFPAAVGEGELLIGGEQVMTGYLNDAALTSHVTVVINGRSYYRTGDIVNCDENGLYVFKRRKNDMIKIRGYRIFPSEVENEIRIYAGVKDCFLVKREEHGFVETLRAYIIPESEDAVDLNTLKQFLAGKLPSYMIPHSFRLVDTVPMKPNGKVDRYSLSLMD